MYTAKNASIHFGIGGKKIRSSVADGFTIKWVRGISGHVEYWQFHKAVTFGGMVPTLTLKIKARSKQHIFTTP